MIRLLLYIVIIVLVLSFFGVSVQTLVNSPVTEANFSYLWHLTVTGWEELILAIQNYFQNLASELHL